MYREPDFAVIEAPLVDPDVEPPAEVLLPVEPDIEPPADVPPDEDVVPLVPAVPDDAPPAPERTEASVRMYSAPAPVVRVAAVDEPLASARQPVTVISDADADERDCVLLCEPVGEPVVGVLCAAAPTTEATASVTVAPQK